MTDILEKESTKYNENVKLTPEDEAAGMKIYSKDSNAQETYDKYAAYFDKLEHGTPCKDLELGGIFKVRPVQVDFDNKIIACEELSSSVPVYIAFRDYSESPKSLIEGDISPFYVIVTKDKNGEFYASQKKALAITYKQNLIDAYENEEYFEVKVERLIRGGFVASYKGTVKCFIPGSHAAANVIHDFNKYIGKVIPVMIDNYDQANDLFIVSYKKYINKTMPERITELSFGHKYTGILTNDPYDFGVFVEFEEYFTGLIHKSDFEDYEKIKKEWKTGQEVEFYIKDASMKKGKYRIFCTLAESEINEEKAHWTQIREQAENQTFDYEADLKTGKIKINVNGSALEIGIQPKELKKNVDKFPFVKVFKVDPINKNLKLDFVEEK